MSSPSDSLDTMHTGVPHVAVDLSTEISLAAVPVVVMEPVETPVSKHSLLRTQTCVSAASMADIVGPLIGERFSMTIDLVEELTRQLNVYFEFAGVMNDETYSFMTDYKEWPSAKGVDSETLNMVTVPVTLLLAKLASYTVLVLENKLFLSPGVKFSELRL